MGVWWDTKKQAFEGVKKNVNDISGFKYYQAEQPWNYGGYVYIDTPLNNWDCSLGPSNTNLYPKQNPSKWYASVNRLLPSPLNVCNKLLQVFCFWNLGKIKYLSEFYESNKSLRKKKINRVTKIVSANVKLFFLLFSVPTQTGDKVDWAGVIEKQMCLPDWLSHEQSMVMPLFRICILINF